MFCVFGIFRVDQSTYFEEESFYRNLCGWVLKRTLNLSKELKSTCGICIFSEEGSLDL